MSTKWMLKLDIKAPHKVMAEEVVNSPLWDSVRIRTTHENTPHAQVSDILLRFNEMQATVQQALDDCETYPLDGWSQFMVCRNVALDLMRYVEGTRLGRVMLTRLPHGGKIVPHADAGTPATYYERYHVVIGSGEGPNRFRVMDEWVDMRPGEVWWVNNAVEHEVVNDSGADRIHMIVDIREDVTVTQTGEGT